MARAAREEKASPEPDPVPARPDPHLHRGKCTICRHPQRQEIERAFVDWASAREIARTFGLRSHTTVYRHAHARHLFEHRRRNLHMALGRIVERVGEIEPTAGNVIAAIALMAKINARGEWSAGRFSLHEARDRAYWDGVSSEQCEIDLSAALSGETTAEPANEQEEEPEAEAEPEVEAEVEDEAEAEFEDEDAADETGSEQSKDFCRGDRSGRPSPEPAALVGMGGSQLSAPTLATVAGRGDVPSPVPPAPETQHREPEPPGQNTAPDPATASPPIALSGPPLVAGIPWPWSPKNPLTFSRRRRRRPPPR